MFQIVLLLCGALLSGTSAASQTAFYPLPTQASGNILVGNQLYPSQDGGLWIQDMQRRVKFFDGVELLPKVGSALNYSPAQLTYHQRAFWSFAGNEVYRLQPAQERERVFGLTPGSDINQIGASQGYIWVTDQDGFYAYQINTGKLTRFALTRLYQYSQLASIKIQAAQFIDSRWVVATNAGVYLSARNGFSHIDASNKDNVSLLHYSSKRRELLIGSDDGALLVNVDDPTYQPVTLLAHGNITALAETPDSYWIGTDNGLYIQHFFPNSQEYIIGLGTEPFELQGQSIHALLAEPRGGVWVSTENGIQYYSPYSAQFERQPQPIDDANKQRLQIRSLHLTQAQNGYWLQAQSGLYRLADNNQTDAERVYLGDALDFVEINQSLWIATPKGIVVIDAQSGKSESKDLPRFMTTEPVSQLEFNAKRHQLWGISQGELWRYDLRSGELKRFSNHWLNNSTMPQSHWHLFAMQSGTLLLSTGSHLYVIDGEAVHLVSHAQHVGRIFDFIEVEPSVVWGSSAYGVFAYDIKQRLFRNLPLPAEGVSPKCLVRNQDGIWLTSSAGLSRYQSDGSIVEHYSPPFGVLYNEFLPSSCTPLANDKHGLLLGSKYGLVSVNSYSLTTNPLPPAKIIVSQVRVNQVLHSVGGSVGLPIKLEYDDVVSVRLGGIPMFSKPKFEYRFNDEQPWLPVVGQQLTLSHLEAGEYELMVRQQMPNNATIYSMPVLFTVAKPWYLGRYAIATYVVCLMFGAALLLWWRSRLSKRNHRFLQAQVGLKTEQLRHQGRVLIANNHQLRKQLQLRRLVFSHVLDGMKKRLHRQVLSASSLKDQQYLVEQIYAELDLLENVRSDKTGSQAVFDLEVVVESALEVWREEFERREVSVSLEKSSHQAALIEVFEFNLDEVLSALFNNLLRRSYRKQHISLNVELREQRVLLVCCDQGKALVEADLSITDWSAFKKQVTQSGGQLAIFSSSERNLVELSWSSHHVFDEFDVNEPGELPLDDSGSQLLFEPWLQKLEQLVQEQFSDPEFGTTSAAKLMFVSERSLQRRFKQLTGRTFKDYLNEVRLEHACRQLLEGDKVSDVAFACGFNDPSYFSQRFKAQFGASPTQFIESQEVL